MPQITIHSIILYSMLYTNWIHKIPKQSSQMPWRISMRFILIWHSHLQICSSKNIRKRILIRIAREEIRKMLILVIGIRLSGRLVNTGHSKKCLYLPRIAGCLKVAVIALITIICSKLASSCMKIQKRHQSFCNYHIWNYALRFPSIWFFKQYLHCRI